MNWIVSGLLGVFLGAFFAMFLFALMSVSRDRNVLSPVHSELKIREFLPQLRDMFCVADVLYNGCHVISDEWAEDRASWDKQFEDFYKMFGQEYIYRIHIHVKDQHHSTIFIEGGSHRYEPDNYNQWPS